MKVVIIGAGPAGLAAAYTLKKHGVNAVVYEQSEAVGGLSRTIEHDGYRFDIGGHRFFTKSPDVQQLLGTCARFWGKETRDILCALGHLGSFGNDPMLLVPQPCIVWSQILHTRPALS